MLTHENVVADAAGVLKTFEVHENKSGPLLNIFVLIPFSSSKAYILFSLP